ncbi:MAG: hypothetical protein ABW005_02685 [Burkholderiaceae bacterium]
MSFAHAHALAWIDHQNAKILQFDAQDVEARKLRVHTHPTRQHGSGVRSEHEYFAAICDSLAPIGEVLVTGPRTAQSDFQHYVSKHRPALLPQIVGWEVADPASDAELVARGRRYFDKRARMAGTP